MPTTAARKPKPTLDGQPPATGLSESSRKKIRDHLRDELKTADVIDIPTLTRQTIAWATETPGILKTLLDELLYPTFYHLTTEILSRSRQGLHLVPSGGAAMTEAALEQAAQEIETKFVGSKWSNWCEHVRHGRTIILSRMSSLDLRDAAQIRRDRARKDDHLSRLWEALAERLEPDQVVEDAWSDEEIEAVSQRLQDEAKAKH